MLLLYTSSAILSIIRYFGDGTRLAYYSRCAGKCIPYSKLITPCPLFILFPMTVITAANISQVENFFYVPLNRFYTNAYFICNDWSHNFIMCTHLCLYKFNQLYCIVRDSVFAGVKPLISVSVICNRNIASMEFIVKL